MDVNKPETAKMSVTASLEETRNKIGELTTSIGNISFPSRKEDSILKKEIPEKLTETKKVRWLPMPRSRPIDRKQVDQLIDRLIGNKIIERSVTLMAECNGYSHKINMQKLKN